jgi:hypothetical protein
LLNSDTKPSLSGRRSKFDADRKPKSTGDSLERGKRGADSAGLEPIDGGLAGAHTAGKLTLTQARCLSSGLDTRTNLGGELGFGVGPLVLCTLVGAHGAKLLAF